MPDDTEPEWLQRIRPSAKQRPRTQYVKVRWHDLQELLRERDFLLHQASRKTKAALGSLLKEGGGLTDRRVFAATGPIPAESQRNQPAGATRSPRIDAGRTDGALNGARAPP